MQSVIETARSHIKEGINCADAHEILFTSGGTESNNLAIIGACLYRTHPSSLFFAH
jgi:cysteine desulfurase